METKHKECFIPLFIKYFRLQAVSKYAREAWEFVSLYSKSRGMNRFPALVRTLELLRQRPEVLARGVTIPPTTALSAWVARETRLTNSALAEAVKSGIQELKPVLDWSLAVNEMIENYVCGVPPFPFFRDCLRQMSMKADVVVVSQTPTDALMREWQEHDIAKYVYAIAGQELGSKADHIRYAASGKYSPHRTLMIGDALGDYEASRANGALFYPIIPGGEDHSWKRFNDEAMELFFSDRFVGPYENQLLREFDATLPEDPHWGKSRGGTNL
jgi:phosphoglycolate phosphatase-like HAD superfamily hydrolase